MKGKIILRDFLKVTLATLILFALVESLLRGTFFIRNSIMPVVPIPYVIGENYGPVPPWVDNLRILERDETLFWKNRPNLSRTYIDIFSPAHTVEDRTKDIR